MAGGPEGIRTPDLFSAIEARSQLRYRPAQKAKDILPEAQGDVKQTHSVFVNQNVNDAEPPNQNITEETYLQFIPFASAPNSIKKVNRLRRLFL